VNWKNLFAALGILIGVVVFCVVFIGFVVVVTIAGAALSRLFPRTMIALTGVFVGLVVFMLILVPTRIGLNLAKDYRMWSRLRIDTGSSIAPGVFLKVLSSLRTDSMRTRILRIIRQNSLFQATSSSERVLTCLAIAIEHEKKFPSNMLESPEARIEISEGCPEFLAWYKEYLTSYPGGLRSWSPDTLDEIARLEEQVRAVRAGILPGRTGPIHNPPTPRSCNP
jgi:hypothetical protein